MDDEQTCHASGFVVRLAEEVGVGMEWHISHELSDEFKADFLRLRCRALEAVFGDLNNAQGMLNIMCAGLLGPHVVKKIVHRPKKCGVLMGFAWPAVDDKKWEEIKEGFKEVFELAQLHGEVDCDESETRINITSTFELAEKGGD